MEEKPKGIVPGDDEEASYRSSLSRLRERIAETEFEKLGNMMKAGGPSGRKIAVFAFRPGTGKTTFIAKELVELHKTGKLERGAIIMFSRHKELDQFLKALEANGIDPKAFVVISDEKYDLKGAGIKAASTAPIALTTQQKVETRVGDGRFEDCSLFWYKGKSRYLRIWDETIERAKGITFTRDDLAALPRTLRSSAPVLVGSVEGLMEELDKARPDHVVFIEPAIGTMASHVLAVASGLPDRDVDTLEKLAVLGGKNVLVSSDSFYRWSISGVGQRLPADLGPLIVLDGSGSIRQTYDVWEASGGQAYRAGELAIRYTNLRFHWWKNASGRTVQTDRVRLQEIVAAAADLLNEDPSEKWLVIGFKPHWKADLKGALRAKLIAKDQVEYLTWGDHHGLNSYTHIKKVLAVGPLRYSDADYRAKYLAAEGGVVAPVPREELKKIELGEVRHNLLQAICRANVRNQKGLVCGGCDVYLIMADKDDLEAQLLETFPMCRIEPWLPVPPKVRGRPAEVINYLTGFFADPKNERLTKDELRTALGYARKQDLTKALKSPFIKPFLIDAKVTMQRTCFERSV